MKDLRKVESPGVSEMIEKKRRLTTWLVIGIGSLVLVVAGFASKDKAVERWYLSKLKSEDREEQRTAIQKLGEMRSASAAPRLVELFREQNTRQSFGRDDLRLRAALVAIGEPSVPHLIELTRDRRPAVRSAAWTVLGEVGLVAIPHLLQDFDQADEEDRVQLLEDLGRANWNRGEVPSELVEACGDASPRVREAAISAVATVAPESHGTIETLVTALEDEDDIVRFAAAIRLARLSDPRAKAAVPELVLAVMDEVLRGQSQWRATRSRLGGPQRPAVSALSQLLTNLDHPGPPELFNASSDESPRVRAAAIDALATVAPTSRSTIDTLVGALEDEDTRVRFAAAIHLVELSDPRAKAAVPELISAVTDESLGRHRRKTAARLLGMQRSAAAIPALIEMLKDEHPQIAVWALERIGPPAKAAIPLLSRIAENQDYVGQQALRALAAIQAEDSGDNNVRSSSR